jgi:cytidine deaminase
MKPLPITEQDKELITAAQAIINKLYVQDKHHVGAAIRTKSGKIITAVHVEAYISRITVCAEAIAIGKAISEGENTFDTIVAVRHPYGDEEDREIKVVSPCGMCRELLSDYGPDIKVIIPYNGQIVKCDISELIPLKYTRK